MLSKALVFRLFSPFWLKRKQQNNSELSAVKQRENSGRSAAAAAVPSARGVRSNRSCQPPPTRSLGCGSPCSVATEEGWGGGRRHRLGPPGGSGGRAPRVVRRGHFRRTPIYSYLPPSPGLGGQPKSICVVEWNFRGHAPLPHRSGCSLPRRCFFAFSSSSGFGLSISEPLESGDAGPRMNRPCGRSGTKQEQSMLVPAIQRCDNIIITKRR
jgi:hypothetical protein